MLKSVTLSSLLEHTDKEVSPVHHTDPILTPNFWSSGWQPCFVLCRSNVKILLQDSTILRENLHGTFNRLRQMPGHCVK